VRVRARLAASVRVSARSAETPAGRVGGGRAAPSGEWPRSLSCPPNRPDDGPRWQRGEPGAGQTQKSAHYCAVLLVVVAGVWPGRAWPAGRPPAERQRWVRLTLRVRSRACISLRRRSATATSRCSSTPARGLDPGFGTTTVGTDRRVHRQPPIELAAGHLEVARLHRGGVEDRQHDVVNLGPGHGRTVAHLQDPTTTSLPGTRAPTWHTQSSWSASTWTPGDATEAGSSARMTRTPLFLLDLAFATLLQDECSRQ